MCLYLGTESPDVYARGKDGYDVDERERRETSKKQKQKKRAGNRGRFQETMPPFLFRL